MKNGGAQADRGGRGQDAAITWSQRELDEAQEGYAHSQDEGVRPWILIGVKSNEGLENGADHLKGEGNEPNPGKTQVERVFKQGVNRRN